MKGLALSTILLFMLMMAGIVIGFRSNAEYDTSMLMTGVVVALVGIVGLFACGIAFLIIE